MYRYIYAFLAMATMVYAGSITLLSTDIARWLGAGSAAQLSIASRALPAFAAYLILMSMVCLLLPAYQFYARKALSYVHSVCVTLVPPLGYALYACADTDYCWWGFAIGELIVCVVLLTLTETIRRKDKSLLPLILIHSS